ncbi:MAG: glycosyltransferase family 2 protein [Patescibacteria group bacterium]
MKKPSLSIIIPALNEEQSLGYVLNDTLKNLPELVRDFEIIIVNDGSTDNTRKIAESFVRKDKRIHLINQRNKGFSRALIQGIKAAKKDYISYMQGNGQDLVRDLVNCFKVMDRYDLVLGVRGKRIDYDINRLVLSYGGLILYWALFGIKYEDVHWAYVWNSKEIQNMKLDPDGGMFVMVESLIRFKRKGLKIKKISSPYRPRFAGVGRNTSPKVISKTLTTIFKLWWKILIGKI